MSARSPRPSPTVPPRRPESEAWSSEALRELPGVAVFVVGHDLRFRFAYGDALRAAGYAEQNLEGRTLTEVLGPRAAALEPLYRRALAGETLAFDTLAGDAVHEVRAAPVRGADGAVVAATLLSIDVTEQRRAAARLRESERRGSALAATLDGASESFYLLDDEWRFQYINRTAERFLCGGHPTARSAADLLGVELWEAFPETVGRPFEEALRRARATGQVTALDVYYPPFDAWFKVAAKPASTGLLIQAEDVTELRRSQARLEHIAANVPGMVYRFRISADHESSFPYVSDGARDVYGLEPDAIRADASLILDAVHPADRDHFRESIAVSAQTLEPWAWEGRIVRRDGTMRWLQAVSRPERQGDGSTIWDGVLLDATRAREAEETIRWQAHHDGLTGLPNRTVYLDRLEDALVRARRDGERIAVCFIDLDRFKEVNDTLGHALGDRVLRAAAGRVAGCVRPGDTVARLGGDELTVLLTHLPSAEFAADVALRIIGAFADPLQVDEHAVSLSCSVGLVMAVDPDVDADSLLRDADTAMYRAKELGRGRLHLFNEELADRVRRRLSLSAALREALGRDEFRLVYQPQLDTATGRCLSAEALLRWAPASHDPVGPDIFVGLAEELGLISGIGEWVIRSATRRAAAWRAAGAPRRVSVNVSAHQLRDGRLPGLVRDALATAGLPGELLELELTESGLIAHGDGAMDQLEAIRVLGVHISLDDFGTGYSSLAYLRRLPLDGVKIDRSLTPAADDDAGIGLVQGVIHLCHALHLEIVAEGVEDDAQERLLARLGCDRLQGHHIGRPHRGDEAPELRVGRT